MEIKNEWAAMACLRDWAWLIFIRGLDEFISRTRFEAFEKGMMKGSKKLAVPKFRLIFRLFRSFLGKNYILLPALSTKW